MKIRFGNGISKWSSNWYRRLACTIHVVVLKWRQTHFLHVNIGEGKVGVSAQMGIDVFWQKLAFIFAMLRPIREIASDHIFS